MSTEDEPPRLRVFLCHASPDKPRVRDLYRRLQVEGVEPWLDEINIIPGQHWEMEIRKAFRAADVALVCLSPKSIVKTGYVQTEIRALLKIAEQQVEGTIFIIPVKFQECEIPESLSDLHSVNLFDEHGYANLMRALRSRAAQCGCRPLFPADPVEDSLPEYFTNREELRRALENAAAGRQSSARRVCMLQGEVGAGKSAVLRMLHLYCKKNGIPSVLISARQGITEIQLLRQLSEGLEQYDVDLTGFNSVWELSQASSELGKELLHQTLQPRVTVSGGGSDPSSAAKISTATQEVGSVSILLSTVRMTSERFLTLDPLTQLTDEFVRAINDLASSNRAVLLLDFQEEAANLDAWLGSWLRRLSRRILVVIAGQKLLNTAEWQHTWPDWALYLRVETLPPLADADRRLLVERLYKMIFDKPLSAADVNEIVASAGNTPLSLQLEVLMRSWGYRGPRQTSPDDLKTIVNLLFHGMPRELLPVGEAAGILRSPNSDVLQAVIGETHALENMAHVAHLRFLVAKSNALRNVMNNYLRLQDPEHYRTLHQNASEYYRKRASDLDLLEPATLEDNKERQKAELEWLYHRFQLAEADGMEEFGRLFERSFVFRQELDFCRSLINEARACCGDPTSMARLRLYEIVLNIRVGKQVAESEQSLRELMLQEFDNRHLRTEILESLATVHWLQGSIDEAKKVYEECLASLAALPEDLPGKFRALIGLGRLYKRTGTADAMLLQAQEISKAWNDDAASALLARELGDAFRLQGRFSEADELLRQSIESYERLRFEFEKAHSIRIRAMLLIYMGQFRQADQLFERSISLFESKGKDHVRVYESVWTSMGRGDAALGRRHFHRAEDLYMNALRLCVDKEFETSVLQGCLADLYCEQQAWERSLVCSDLSLTVRRKHGDQFGIAWTSYTKGIVLFRTGRLDEALATLSEGLKVAEKYHSYFLESKLMLGLCEIFFHTGDLTKFRDSALRVRQLSEQFSYLDHSARVNVLEGLLLFSELRTSEDRTIVSRAAETLIRGLADALRFSVVRLDALVTDILESPAWSALGDSEKIEFVQIFENRWMSDQALLDLESRERLAEYGRGKERSTMIRSFRDKFGRAKDRGATI